MYCRPTEYWSENTQFGYSMLFGLTPLSGLPITAICARIPSFSRDDLSSNWQLHGQISLLFCSVVVFVWSNSRAQDRSKCFNSNANHDAYYCVLLLLVVYDLACLGRLWCSQFKSLTLTNWIFNGTRTSWRLWAFTRFYFFQFFFFRVIYYYFFHLLLFLLGVVACVGTSGAHPGSTPHSGTAPRKRKTKKINRGRSVFCCLLVACLDCLCSFFVSFVRLLCFP